MRRTDSGFTLLEIIVAVVVFGILIAGLSQTVHFGLVAWRAEGRQSTKNTDLETVDSTLRIVIANLAPEDDNGDPAIIGTNQTLTGISRMPIPETGLREAPVEVGLAVSGNRLVLRWRPYTHAEPLRGLPPLAEASLAEGVGRLRIAYWKPSGGWADVWNQPALPKLVRLRLTFLGKHPPHWPDLVIAPILSRP